MPLPPTVGLCAGASGTGREGDGKMSRGFLDFVGVTGISSNDDECS